MLRRHWIPAAAALIALSASAAAADTVPLTIPGSAVAPDRGTDIIHVRAPFSLVAPEDHADIIPAGPASVVAEPRISGPAPRPQGPQGPQGTPPYGLTEAIAPEHPVARAFPNPSTPGTVVTVRAGEASVNVQVYDVNGRRIADVTGTGGDAAWDGRDLAGRAVTPGVYFARVTTGEVPAQTVRIVRK